MTAATLSRLPISAGGAAAASLARGVYWVLNRLIDFGYLVAGQFMRAPLAISTIAAIVGFSLLAGGNALYFQANRHPAPLFFAPPRHVSPAPVAKPVIPATRHPQAAIDDETTGSLGNSPTVDTIDNADVMTLQRKLAALKFFDGTADGIFGRRTATAIKAFEIKAGLRPHGKLTRELLATILAAPVPSAAQPLPAPTTVADIAPMAAPRPATVKPVPAIAAEAAPVPLAPTKRTVSTIQVASTAPTTPTDTFSANSLPAADEAAAAPAGVPASAAATPAQTQAPLAPAPQAVAPMVTAPAEDSTADSSVVAMNSLPPDKATLPADAQSSAAQQVASIQPTQDATPAAAPADLASLTPAQRLAAQIGTLPPAATTNVASTTAAPTADDATTNVASSDPGDDAGSTDPALITKIQRGLASLGFLAQKIDGVPGEGTAKAIRNFEVFYDYRVTGLATPQLLNLLVQHGAQT